MNNCPQNMDVLLSLKSKVQITCKAHTARYGYAYLVAVRFGSRLLNFKFKKHEL